MEPKVNSLEQYFILSFVASTYSNDIYKFGIFVSANLLFLQGHIVACLQVLVLLFWLTHKEENGYCSPVAALSLTKEDWFCMACFSLSVCSITSGLSVIFLNRLSTDLFVEWTNRWKAGEDTRMPPKRAAPCVRPSLSIRSISSMCTHARAERKSWQTWGPNC